MTYIPETGIFICVLLGMALTAVIGILVCPAPEEPEIEVDEVCVFDREEVYHNCTVQVLENSVTGEVSVGWTRDGNIAKTISDWEEF